jgi:hypothetical protein
MPAYWKRNGNVYVRRHFTDDGAPVCVLSAQGMLEEFLAECQRMGVVPKSGNAPLRSFDISFEVLDKRGA